ncbi:MAG: hypothetical protein ACYC6T_07315 [Thermoleophilia bacterium]
MVAADGLPATHRSAFQRLAQRGLDAVSRRSEFDETEYVPLTVELIERSGPFPPIPLVVVTGGRPARFGRAPAPAREARAQNQRRLAALSPKGRQIVAGGSGHFPHLTEPAVPQPGLVSWRNSHGSHSLVVVREGSVVETRKRLEARGRARSLGLQYLQ